VFLEPQAALYLDDKVLDAQVDEQGDAHFGLRTQALGDIGPVPLLHGADRRRGAPRPGGPLPPPAPHSHDPDQCSRPGAVLGLAVLSVVFAAVLR